MSDPGELTCQEFVELVTDYLEGALSHAEAQRFEAHLADCHPCVEYLAQMRETIRAVGQLREEHVPPAARDELLRAFRDWKRSAGLVGLA
jgi:anti-sigma factor RsiW